jgi:hypothetical protein
MILYIHWEHSKCNVCQNTGENKKEIHNLSIRNQELLFSFTIMVIKTHANYTKIYVQNAKNNWEIVPYHILQNYKNVDNNFKTCLQI